MPKISTRDADIFATKRQSIATKLLRVEEALGDGPWFNSTDFGLVDAAFGPLFRYFDLFDTLADLHLWDDVPKVVRWRQALASRPSVAGAAPVDYRDLLMAFLERHQAHMLALR